DKCPALHKETLAFDVSLDPTYLTGEEIGEALEKIRAIEKFSEGLRREAMLRALRGEGIAHHKVVRQISHRTWKKNAERMLKKKFGTKAYEEPKLLSPPNIEKLPGGKAFVAEWAFKPDRG